MSYLRFSKFLKAATVTMRNAVLAGNVASLPLLCHPHQFLTYVTESLFLYRSLTNTPGIPKKNVFDALSCGNGLHARLSEVKLSFPLGQDTWFRTVSSYACDLVNLCLLAQILKPRVVFEIGTLHGYTALHLALNSPPDAHVYTLDLPSGSPPSPELETTMADDRLIASHAANTAYVFEASGVEDKIRCLYGDSAAFDFTPYLGSVDLFFIDGAHSFEYVRSDTMNAMRCCHAGSVIAWHDFGRMGVNGVSKWLGILSKHSEIYSVPGGSLAFMVVPSRPGFAQSC